MERPKAGTKGTMTQDAAEHEPRRAEGLHAAARTAVSLTRLTAKAAKEDRITGIAAEIAFFALLAIPSTLLLLAGLAGYAGRLFGADVSATLQEQITRGLGSFLSPDVMAEFVGPFVRDLFSGGRPDLLSVGALLGLWSMSRAVKVLIEAMNLAYDIEDWRPAWRRRLLAVGLGVAGLVALSVTVPLMLAGPHVGASLVRRYSLPGAVASVWRIVYWPAAIIVVVSIITTVYHIAPNWKTPWRRDVPGAILAAAAWIAAAWGLRVYVSQSISESTAGPLAAPTILLLWLYVSSLALLIGAELNAEIERLQAATGAARRGQSMTILERLGSRRARRTKKEAEDAGLIEHHHADDDGGGADGDQT